MKGKNIKNWYFNTSCYYFDSTCESFYIAGYPLGETIIQPLKVLTLSKKSLSIGFDFFDKKNQNYTEKMKKWEKEIIKQEELLKKENNYSISELLASLETVQQNEKGQEGAKKVLNEVIEAGVKADYFDSYQDGKIMIGRGLKYMTEQEKKIFYQDNRIWEE